MNLWLRLNSIQYLDSNPDRVLAVRSSSDRFFIRRDGYRTLYELASAAANVESGTLKDLTPDQAHGLKSISNWQQKTTLRPPIDHPEPARLYVTGMVLTHLGSVAGEDSMHHKLQDSAKAIDSMKVF